MIAANWKMYKNRTEAKEFCVLLKNLLANNKAEGIIFAPFTLLSTLEDELKDTKIALGAQNFYPAKEGAYTGEISPDMLKDFGVTYVLIGHSERRTIFKEDDEFIHTKVQMAYQNQLKVILCCGETIEDRENGQAISHCLKQIQTGVAGLTTEELKELVIAYEPIWAIGSGKSTTSNDAEEMSAAIRSYLKDTYGSEVSEQVRILYGGSVKPENIKELMQQKNIDGALIGGASLNAESFHQLLCYEER